MQIEITEKIAPTATACPSCGQGGATKFLQAPDRYHGRHDLYQLLRCPSCSLVWLDNPPRPNEMGVHYGGDYDRSVSAAGEDLGRWQYKHEVVLRHKTGGAILDLGCSSGGFLASLKGPSWRRHGIEMSAKVAEIAKAKCGADVFVGDILDAPYPPATFDVITCFHVFEHLYQPREILAKVSEWLKQGGIFYTNMPNIHSAGSRTFGAYWYALELPRHLYHFSPTSLRFLAGSAGLEEVWLITGREPFIEASTRYYIDDLLL